MTEKGLPVRLGLAHLRAEPRGVLRLVGAAGGPPVDVARAAENDLRRRGATGERATQLAAAAFPASLTQVLSGGAAVTGWLRRLLAGPGEDAEIDPAELRLRCPVDPPSYRDFMSFDEHVRNTYAPTGRRPPDVLYELPAYYKGSTATLIGPEDEVRWPHYAASVDYELEFAMVIGSPGIDVHPSAALAHVFGVTVLSDFSARDMQFTEMRSRLGPAKGKDFATALGPWVVTLDELEARPADDDRRRQRAGGGPGMRGHGPVAARGTGGLGLSGGATPARGHPRQRDRRRGERPGAQPRAGRR